jgi:hypothetical protein
MMKRTLTAAALAAVLAAPAFAQSPPSPGTPGTMTKPDAAQTAPMTKPDAAKPAATDTKNTAAMPAISESSNFVTAQNSADWRGSKLIGATVYGPDNASIGDINDVLIANDGKINAVVIGVGGFLGVGEKTVAIPFDKLQVTRKADSASIDKITVSYSKDELKNAPKFAFYEPASKASTTGAGSSLGERAKGLNPMSGTGTQK